MKRPCLGDAPATLAVQGLPRTFDERPDTAGPRREIIVRAGGLRLLHAPDAAQETWLVETLSGIRYAGAVRVRFLEHDWRALPAAYADALRGRIGHVIGANDWDPAIPVADTLVLAERFHTRRALADIRREAAALAPALGLPGLPLSFPWEIDARDLARAAIISAFVGAPAMVLLRAIPHELRASVANLAWTARHRGAAVVWILRDDSLVQASRPAPGCAQAALRCAGGVA